MSSLVIVGGYPIAGEIHVQGSKNAALPLMAASLLIQGTTILEHCPNISDVTGMMEILKYLGCTVLRDGETVIIDAEQIKQTEVVREHAEKMRSSVLMLGALLGRKAQAEIPLPGGCSIGRRPVDLHLMALQKLGAEIEEKDSLRAVIRKCQSTEIVFPYPSVGAVQNALLASVVSEATVVMRNCAREPEVEELCHFLNHAGARITGVGTDTLVVRGVKTLDEIRYRIRSDRIAAGTYMAMAAATRGEVSVCDVNPFELSAVTSIFAVMGCHVKLYTDAIALKTVQNMKGVPLLQTLPYPGFPTDMQSQLMSVLSLADGNSVVRETVFENRFATAEELKKMNANITLLAETQTAFIRGRKQLRAAEVKAPDLRGGAALVIAAMAAEGTSRVENGIYIERGYEKIEEKIRMLGGHCQRDAVQNENQE